MSSEGAPRFAQMSIFGFAANQAFIFSLFYLGSNQAVDFGFIILERAELFGVLVCLIIAFAVLSLVGPRARDAMLSRGLIWSYAILFIVGYLIPLVTGGQNGVTVVVSSLLTGIPAGFLLCGWGRRLGRYPVSQSVPEVFIASALAAVADFFFGLFPFQVAVVATCIYPLISAFCLRGVDTDVASDTSEEVEATPAPDLLSDESASSVIHLSTKVLLGTAMYGLATGMMEVLGSEPGMATTPTLPFSLLIFVLFCLAAFQLFGRSRLSLADSERGKPSESAAKRDGGPLDGSYRIALLLMVGGFLFFPVFGGLEIEGVSIVLAGYLGISLVLISLFLIMARLTDDDATLSFAHGFLALFVGEVVGLLIGNAIDFWGLPSFASYGIAALGGLITLYAYLFLFTEHDLYSLSVAVQETDRFEEACELIANEAGLSAREREILPLALRGRTSERIAGEFYISKNTVETHLRRIYTKCGVHNKQELIDLGEKTAESLKGR